MDWEGQLTTWDLWSSGMLGSWHSFAIQTLITDSHKVFDQVLEVRDAGPGFGMDGAACFETFINSDEGYI